MSFFYNIYVKPAYGHTPKQSQTYKDMWKAGYDFYVDDWREFSNRDTLHLIQDGAILVVFPMTTPALVFPMTTPTSS